MYAAVTVTLNRDEMERRRLQAAEDLLKGITQARVARKFGVSRTTASRWYRTLDGQGVESVSYTHLDVYKRQEQGAFTKGLDQKLARTAAGAVKQLHVLGCLLYTSRCV